MEIKKNQSGNSLVINVIGRLDAATAPQLEKELNESLATIKNLTLILVSWNMLHLLGLRVLLIAQKRMNKQGNMTVKNVSNEIKEVLDMTGFIIFLNVEE